MLQSLDVARGDDMIVPWVSLAWQTSWIQTHGIERRLHNVALLVERQILMRDAGAPLNLIVPLAVATKHLHALTYSADIECRIHYIKICTKHLCLEFFWQRKACAWQQASRE